VLTEGRHAARFLVRGGGVVQFSLYLRSYASGAAPCLVLPPRQGRPPWPPGAWRELSCC